MPKAPAPPKSPQPAGSGADARAEAALQHALAVAGPLVLWLLRNGVNYGAFATALKSVFLAQARAELAAGGAKLSDSALSVLSGLHRKDVRSLASGAKQPLQALSPTLVSQLFTRWVSDARYRGKDGSVRRLPRSGPAPSFESLAREISTDVHPRTLLEELLRLELAALEGDEVVLRAQAFVPTQGGAEMLALFAANAADHLAASVHNLTRPSQPKFLEQSVYADGLSEASAQVLASLARELWADAFRRMVAEATQRVEEDAALSPEAAATRMRYGVYYYHEAVEPPAQDAASPQQEIKP